MQQSAHHSFIAVNKEAVEEFGDKWTEPAKSSRTAPSSSSVGAQRRDRYRQWTDWRDADNVKLTRVNGRMIEDGTTAVQAFEAGELDVTDELAAGRDRSGLRRRP